MKKPLIIIAGPTATGKTALSVALAKKINGEIISADSMQIYKYMDIGSAKVMPDEMQGVKHFLIDELYPDDIYNVNVFQSMAKAAMKEIYDKGKIPILVGGTGFYIQSIVYDIDFEEMETDLGLRKELEDVASVNGNEFLHEMLKEIDPVSYEKIHANNVKRVIRAIEYYRVNKKPISAHNEKESLKESPYNVLFNVLTMDRKILYNRIDNRVDRMIENGLVEEVAKLQEKGYKKELVAMQGIGYKEIIAYLLGDYDVERSVEILKQNTRHFAKRQLTWFKREEIANWINVDAYDFKLGLIVDDIVTRCKNLNMV